MAETLLEQSAAISDLLTAMQKAEEASEGLGRSFAEASKESLLWTTAARILSGSGLWRLQARIRAVGNIMKLYYDQQTKLREEEFERIKMTAELIDAEDKLLKISKNKMDTEDKLFKTYERVYGADLARVKLQERAKDTLEKIDKAKEKTMKLTDKEFKQKLKLSKQATDTINMDKVRVKLQEKMNKVIDVKDDIATLKASMAITTDILDMKRFELELAEKQNELEKEQGSRAKAAKEFGRLTQLKGEIPGMEKEAQFRKIPRPMRIAAEHIKSIGVFIGKIGKIVVQVLRAALLFIGQVLMYGLIVILAIMILKPVILAAWKAWKSFDTAFGSWGDFIRSRWEAVAPAFKKAWGSMKNFFDVLRDPKSTFLDMAISLIVMIKDVFVAIVKFAIEFAIPIMLRLALTVIGVGIKLLVLMWKKVFEFIAWIKKPENIMPLITKAAEVLGNIVDGIFTWADGIWWTFVGWLGEHLDGIKEVLFGWMPEKGKGIPYIKGFAEGGTVLSSGNFIVGERGPEIVSLPGGAAVTPNHMINRPMINNVTVQVQGRIGASDSEVRDIAKKVGAMVSREINRTTASAVRM
jgi:hypothetical protein